MEPKFTDVRSVAAITGLSRQAIYQMITEGRFPSAKIGRRVMVPNDELARYLDGVKGTTAAEALERERAQQA
jgi:excisionase family DNA binding protein